MASKWTRTQAFRLYNTEPRNPNWSWSARSADTVVLTLWKHEFTGPAGRMTYERRGFGDWRNGNGIKSFYDDLVWALAHCSGIVRVIVVVRDWHASPRVRTVECYPARNLVMRVTRVNLVTGAFKLEQVAPANELRSPTDLHVRPQAA